MSTCFNKNLKEYKDLLKVFKTDLSTDAAILKWQKQNKSDLIPTIDQIKEQNRINKNLEKHEKLKFKNALVNNLERLGIAIIQNKEVLITDADALKAYLIQIGVPLDFVKLKSTNEKLFKAEFVLDKIPESKVKRIIKNSSRGVAGASGILAHLSRLFPSVNYKIVSSAEAEELYNSIPEANKAAVPFSQIKSFYNPVNNDVVIIKGRVNEETLIEEVLHPFIDAVYKDNQPLFKNLLKEAKSNFKQLNKEINSVYTDDKGFNQDWRNLELVTKALTKVFKNEYETQPTLTFKQRLQEFKRWFVKILNNIYKYITRRKKPLPVQTLTRKFRSQIDNQQQVSQERLNQVSELFESNPELANEVYETLGFKKLYKEGRVLDLSYISNVIKKLNLNSSVSSFKDSKVKRTVFHISKNKINTFSNSNISKNTNAPDTVLGHFFSEDYCSIATMREIKDDLLLINDQSILGHEVHEVSINLQNPYVLNSFISNLPSNLNIDSNLSKKEQYKKAKEKLEKEGYDGIVYGLEFNGQDVSYGFVVFDEKNIKVENIKNDKDEIEKNRPSDFNKTTKINYDLTTQQKQEAQELYAQYLDTIFPDSKVKDIVYHGTGNYDKIEKFKGRTYFTEKNTAENYADFDRDMRIEDAFSKNIPESEVKVDRQVIPAILNLKNPKYLDKVNFKETEKNYPDNDSIFSTNTVDPLGSNELQIVAFKPEQIHILGSKKDIEGFKDFVQGKPKFDKELAKKIQDKLQKLYPEIKLNITNNPVWEQGDNIFNQEEYNNQVNYRLKAVGILSSDKAKQVFAKGEKNNWPLDKILTELQVPKEQKQIILDKNITENELNTNPYIEYQRNKGNNSDFSKIQFINVYRAEGKITEESKLPKAVQGNAGTWFTNDKTEGKRYASMGNRTLYKLAIPKVLYENLYKSRDKNAEISKGEIQLPKELAKLKEPVTNLREEIITALLTDNSFVVEINTSKISETNTYLKSLGSSVSSLTTERGRYYFTDERDVKIEIAKDSWEEAKLEFDLAEKTKRNTKYYSNLTVPGGTNYTENEIATPAITPSIKGHAQFATDNGIGWFRSDDQTEGAELIEYDDDKKQRIVQESRGGTVTKTRRILEVQSDLFQKGRDKSNLIKTNRLEANITDISNLVETYDRGRKNSLLPIELEAVELYKAGITNIDKINQILNTKLPIKGNENQFLQLLKKDNNWVTFFVKSIIQDSAKKGYEKVLFPKGDTAAKIEGHQTLEEFKKQKKDRIKELEDEKENVAYLLDDSKEVQDAYAILANFPEDKTALQTINNAENNKKESIDLEIKQLRQELADVESGQTQLSSIANFYENTVTNILKKNGYNPVEITDEYGNTWNEITINQARDLAEVLLQRNEANQIIGQANIQAMTVLVDVINQKQDTLPHEYAHHYIAWFRNTPIVQEAIKKWGSEEALVQSIGEQVVKQKGEAWNWWKNFVKWIMNKFNSLSALKKEELTQILTDAFLTKQDLNVKQEKKSEEIETPFNINLGDISEDATLSDIARLLNTSDIQFDIKAQPGGKVKYALSEDLGDLLNNVYKKSTKKQKDVIEKLFALVQSTKVKHNKLYAGEIDLSPTSSLVIMDDKKHVYLSLRNNKIEEYKSATTVINGTKDLSDYELNKNIGNEFDYIVESILLNKTFEEVDSNIKYLKGDKRKQAYQELKNEILSLTEDGSVLLPQVVVHDDIAKIAGTIDILKVTPDGKFTIIDLKTAKDSIYEKSRGKNKYRDVAYELSSDSELFRKGTTSLSKSGAYGLQVGLYSRMLENMGYEIDRDTPHMIFHVKVDITGKGKNQVFNNDFKIEGIDQQVESYNKAYVDMLIPDLTEDVQDIFEEADEDLEDDEDTGYESNETLESPEENEKDNNAQKYPRELFNTLLEYQKKLYKKQEALHVINSKIFLNKPQKEYEKHMFDIMHAIDNMIETIDADKVNALYTRVLRDFYTQLKDFKSYMTDPKNFNKPEYIGYALNYNRFIDGFSPLRTNYKDLNSTHTNLLLRIQSEINDLKDPENIGAGIINDAIYNHVREIVKMSKQELTASEIEDVLHEVEDIDSIEYYTGDLDTNRDVLARMIAKIYKMKLMEVHDRSDSAIEQIRIAARKLQMLSDNKDPQKMHDFMIGEDGRYVQRVSKKFYKEKYRLKSKLYDANGNRKEFIEISDITKASPKDLEYNKQLAKDLEEYYDFFRAESRSEEGSVLDGDYYRYTDDFKKARAKYQVKVDTGEYIFWEKNPEISEIEYKIFENKYYEKPYNDIILRPHKENGVYTGLTVKKAANLRVKSAYKVPTDKTLSGESLIDEQYAKIMGIGSNGEQLRLTALEQAQKEYYLIYTSLFEKVLKYLPEDQVAQMMGRLPVIRGNIMKDVKKMSDVKVKLWSKMVRGFKNLFEDDISVRNVSVDENGEIIQELPIFYTGDLRSEKLLKKINDEIKELEAKYEALEISRDEYQEEMKILKGKRNSVENAPSVEELNRDLTNGLIKFIGMAEYYHVMNQVDDTFKAIKHVMSERKTKEPGGVETLIKKTGKMTTKATREDLKKGFRTTSESNLMRRVNKYLHMVYYQDENLRKTTFDKIANKLINYSSLSYVAFNPFGNFNNYTVAKLSNNIEAFGGRYFSTKSYYKAVYEFNKRAIPDLIKRVSSTNIKSKFVNTGDYDPNKASSKYEALVELFRMMDSKASLRETSEDSTQIRIWESFKEFGYVMQDAVEYNVQTKVGIAMLMDTMIMNPETGDHMSLYDAFEFDNETKKAKLKEGFTKIVELKDGKLVEIADYNDEWRYEFRNKIREVNKQIHGNYAWEDRTVLESQSWGRLLMQFHKWVAPAIKARFRKEYYDENLGWVEGRYRAGLRFVHFIFKKLVAGDLAFKEYAENFKKKEMGGKDSEQYRIKAENALKNAKRAGVEAFIIITLFGATQLLSFLAEDDDDDDDNKELKRLKNFTRYQTDRVFKEFIMFTPLGLTEMYQMFKSPIASSRTLGEMGEAIKYSLSTPIGYLINDKEEFYADKDYVYQKGIRKGQLKLSKNWQDVVPILYSIKKYEDFLNMTNFYIK